MSKVFHPFVHPNCSVRGIEIFWNWRGVFFIYLSLPITPHIVMTTTTDQPGTFVLEIASTGKILVDTFTKFITYRKVKDSRLQDLYATLAVTTTTLTELGNTVNQYENEFRINDDVTRPVCES